MPDKQATNLTSERRARRAAGILAMACAALCQVGLASSARAIEFEPNEIVPAPAGTNGVLGYFYFNRLGEITTANPGGIPDHSASANQFVELARYARWFDFGPGGPLGILEVIQPFSQTFDVETDTGPGKGKSAPGPTIFIAGIWPVNDAANERYLTTLFNLYVPTNGIDGNNRMQYDPQIAFHQGFGQSWSMDLTGDVYFYQNGDVPLPRGATQQFSQNPTYQLQAFANYHFDTKTVASLGWETLLGGKEYLQAFSLGDVNVPGGPTGGATESQRIRAVVSHFFTPNFQVLAEVRHEFVNVGGQRQTIGTLIRALYLF